MIAGIKVVNHRECLSAPPAAHNLIHHLPTSLQGSPHCPTNPTDPTTRARVTTATACPAPARSQRGPKSKLANLPGVSGSISISTQCFDTSSSEKRDMLIPTTFLRSSPASGGEQHGTKETPLKANKRATTQANKGARHKKGQKATTYRPTTTQRGASTTKSRGATTRRPTTRRPTTMPPAQQG